MILSTPRWQINRNGNEGRTIRRSYAKLSNAANDLSEALREVRGEVLHGRNYQTLSDPLTSRARDIDEINELIERVRSVQKHAAVGMLRAARHMSEDD